MNSGLKASAANAKPDLERPGCRRWMTNLRSLLAPCAVSPRAMLSSGVGPTRCTSVWVSVLAWKGMRSGLVLDLAFAGVVDLRLGFIASSFSWMEDIFNRRYFRDQGVEVCEVGGGVCS